MKKSHLELTDEEAKFLERIELNPMRVTASDAHEKYLANREPILALMRSLIARRALPAQRVRYWTDPEFKPGGVRGSREGVFERNGCSGEEIFTHPHFLKYLRYFLFGSELPEVVITAFEQRVGNPEWVSLSDGIPLGKFARGLARQYGLERETAAEEFFKLCLDMGINLSTALSIRKAVLQLR